MQALTNWKFICRHHALTRPHYWFELDEYADGARQFLLCHIRFNKFTAGILKQVIADWDALLTCVKCPLFAVPEDDTPHWRKFVTRLGFVYLHDITCVNGERRPLFISKPKDTLSERFSETRTTGDD